MTDDRLHDLAVRYFDATLSPAEAAELSAALCDSADARAAFADMALLAVGLSERRERVASARPRRRWLGTAAGAAAALVVALAAWALWPARDPAPPVNIAQLEEPFGTVVVGADGRRAGPGTQVHSGEPITTVGLDSTVVIRCPDGTRLFLAGDTTVTLTRVDGLLRLEVERGEVMTLRTTEKREMSPGDYSPLRVRTPEGDLEARGGGVMVARRGDRTQVGLLEGEARVRGPEPKELIVLRPGDRAELGKGKFWRGGRPALPDTLALRGGAPLPPGWELGHPDGTAVRAAAATAKHGGTTYGLRTTNRWLDGLFAVHDDTWLSVRFRVDRPGFFTLLVGCRVRDQAGAGAHMLEAPALWRDREPERWHTVQARLRDFRTVNKPAGPRGPLLAWQVILTSKEADLGLRVDRLWISRGPKPAAFPE